METKPMHLEVPIPQQQKNQHIAVRPYFEEGTMNMGLENYGMVLHDNVAHSEDLTCLMNNGVPRYITGLDEFAPEVIAIKEPKQKEAKIKAIREAVADLEKRLNANVVDPKDKDFWNKIVLLKPNNHSFWSKVNIIVGNSPLFLDPTRDPMDLIKLFAIEAGGFSTIAKNLKDAKSRPTPPKFFLDKQEETSSIRTELTKLRNKAKVLLQTLYDTDPTKLFYVAKVADGNSAQYVRRTPPDVIYENMDTLIDGNGIERNKRRAIDLFTNAAKQDLETLKIHAIVKDASYYQFVRVRADGALYLVNGGSIMGKNVNDVIEWLKNPMNENELRTLIDLVETEWIR
jgi:hypothetical protein